MCAVPPFLSVELYARGGPVTGGVNVSNQEQDWVSSSGTLNFCARARLGFQLWDSEFLRKSKTEFPAVGLLTSATAGAQCQKERLTD